MRRLSRQESQHITRTRLRTAARREFALKGIAAASIDRIAEEAGFSRGAFYANYASKREMLLELVNEQHEQELETWQTLVEQSAGLDHVLPVLEKHFDRFVGQRQHWLLAVELQLEAERDPDFGAVFRQQDEAVMAKVRELIRALTAKAGHAAAIDVDTAAEALRALSLGLLFARRPEHSPTGLSPGGALTAVLRKILAPDPTPVVVMEEGSRE